MNENPFVEKRVQFVNYVKNKLMGEKMKDDYWIGDHPLNHFFTGMLFPVFQDDITEDDFDDDEYEDKNENDESVSEPTKARKRYMPPSAAGFSFFVTGQDITLNIACNAVKYRFRGGRDEFTGQFIKNEWEKEYLSNENTAIKFRLNSVSEYKLWGGIARIYSKWRSMKMGI